MSFSRIRPVLSWTPLSVLLSSEMNAFDTNQSRAVDGFAGGAYAPSTPIVTGGSGHWITSLSIVKSGGEWKWESGAHLLGLAGSVLEWAGEATFETGVVTFTSGAVVSGGTVQFETGSILQIQTGSQIACAAPVLLVNGGTASFGTQSGVTSTFAGPIALSNTITCSGAGPHIAGTCNVGGNLEIVSGGVFDVESGGLGRVLSGGTWTFQAGSTCNLLAPLVSSGSGRVTKRYVAGPDSIATYGGPQADIVNAAAITTGRTYTLTATGGVSGDMIWFLNPTAHVLTIVNDSSVTYTTIASSGSGAINAAQFVFNGVDWTLVSYSKQPLRAARERSARHRSSTPRRVIANGAEIRPSGMATGIHIGRRIAPRKRIGRSTSPRATRVPTRSRSSPASSRVVRAQAVDVPAPVLLARLHPEPPVEAIARFGLPRHARLLRSAAR
jgi:hypothetical protein